VELESGESIFSSSHHTLLIDKSNCVFVQARPHECYHCTASHAAKDDIRKCMFPSVTPVHRATVQEQVLRRMSAFDTQDKDGLVTGVKNWNLYHACAKELKVWPDTNLL
jgi:hypothetical protein